MPQILIVQGERIIVFIFPVNEEILSAFVWKYSDDFTTNLLVLVKLISAFVEATMFLLCHRPSVMSLKN
jgi:hypothetical protein